MQDAHPTPGRCNDFGYIEALARDELTDWFVRDILATAAYEYAAYDRRRALQLLADAICELSARDEADLPNPPELPLATQVIAPRLGSCRKLDYHSGTAEGRNG